MKLKLLPLLLLLLQLHSSHAHNGALAIAVPVERITVDGDLSDWPEGMLVYPIRMNADIYGSTDISGEDLDNSLDFNPEFMVGYNTEEQLIYVAVWVRDDQIEVDIGDWLHTDACEILLDVHHSNHYFKYIISPSGGSYWSNGANPSLSLPGSGTIPLKRTQSRGAFGQKDGIIIYEWALQPDIEEDPLVIESGMSVGFDVIAVDKDKEENPAYISWSPRGATPPRWSIGDLVLVESSARKGLIKGRVEWENKEDGEEQGNVHIQSSTIKNYGFTIRTNSEGIYTAELLEGTYYIKAKYRGKESKEVNVVVKVGTESRVEDIFPEDFIVEKTGKERLGYAEKILVDEFPMELDSRKIKAGTGRKIKGGAGYRQGHWLTFDIPDGLPSSHIQVIHQDREGNLWFGTPNGVSRYDGEYFTNFTENDGLADNDVLEIYEDTNGYLWFGTGGGVSRFDGDMFMNFRFGWLTNSIINICEDSQGNLWFGAFEGVAQFDGSKFSVFRNGEVAFSIVNSILEDKSNNLWFTSGPAFIDGKWKYLRNSFRGVTQYNGSHLTSFSVKDGLADSQITTAVEDQEGNIWFGHWEHGLSRYDGTSFTSFSKDLVGSLVIPLGIDAEGNLWISGSGLVKYNGKQFITMTEDSLFSAVMLEDSEGNLWFGSEQGIVKYNGQIFETFDVDDGLGHNSISVILEDREGSLWIGTGGGGVSRYEPHFSLTIKDGLPDYHVHSMLEDKNGLLWFVTGSHNASRYNGAIISHFQFDHNVKVCLEDHKGNLWFGGDKGLVENNVSKKSSLTKYDGVKFTQMNIEDSLNSDDIFSLSKYRNDHFLLGNSGGVTLYDGANFSSFWRWDQSGRPVVENILEDQTGELWFSLGLERLKERHGRGWTKPGLLRYDGHSSKMFNIYNGSISSDVKTLIEDKEGNIWIGTSDGVSRFDGTFFTSFTVQDGLAHNEVSCILEDRNGHLWFGTQGGISRFDGLVFQHLRKEDGIVDNRITTLLQDRNSDIWVGTEQGITRYKIRHTPPLIKISNVISDTEHGQIDQLSLSTIQNFLAFEFKGLSFKTNWNQIVYIYRLSGHELDWNKTRERRVVYNDLPAGKYTFEVKAVDRDLSYSEEPATVKVVVHPPYDQIALWVSLGISLIGLIVASGYGIKRNRERNRAQRARLELQEKLNQELEEELQTAHDMQMGLMPTESPKIPGFEISGRCLPANHVGGDFFQYFPISDNRLTISLADVTGHAMEAAVPVMMFSGILKIQMEIGGSIEEIFGRLNRSLHGTLDKRTFICFTMGELDRETRTFHLANGGCPYPYHFKDSTDEISELQLDAYPLAIRPNSEYQTVDIQLQQGDRIVFCSDGIIEAENAEGDIYGFERTSEMIRQGCIEGLSAEALIDRLIGAVKAFAGDVPQGDDMTVVVLRVEA